MNTLPEGEEKKIHELKIWGEYFDDVESGRKPFEIRKNDRDFRVGDTLLLKEFALGGAGMTDHDLTRHYTGRETKKKISYLLQGGQWGLSEGNCILGLKATPPVAVPDEKGGESDKDILKKYVSNAYRTYKEAFLGGYRLASTQPSKEGSDAVELDAFRAGYKAFRAFYAMTEYDEAAESSVRKYYNDWQSLKQQTPGEKK